VNCFRIKSQVVVLVEAPVEAEAMDRGIVLLVPTQRTLFRWRTPMVLVLVLMMLNIPDTMHPRHRLCQQLLVPALCTPFRWRLAVLLLHLNLTMLTITLRTVPLYFFSQLSTMRCDAAHGFCVS
jgi:hypothetical protein